ncbi:MAG: nicotinate-nucleotide adenylyltransferase [Gammaproteobacteria bacterium]
MIGIFGGTFDPIHIGHLRPVLEVLQDLALDEVRLIPCHVPPHRPAPVASTMQRLAMLEAAIQGESGLRVDDRELRRTGPSYTVDTLTSLRAELGSAPLCLLLGMDAFTGLNTWHRWRELIQLAHLIVMRRPGSLPPAQGEVAALLAERCTDNTALLHSCPAGHILLKEVTQLDISATRIRTLAKEGKSARYLLPDGVWDMIKKERIYS